jgi:hypothetical protein
MFILKNLIEKSKREKKPMYLAFVDFKKAFDTVWHDGMLFKLLECGVSNKFYTVIKSMYSNTQLAIQDSCGRNISPYFQSTVGVRQGDNLSPTLFNLFINDIPQIFDKTSMPVHFGDMSINCMLYADDLIILSETLEGLQHSMNRLAKYCSQWCLTVNVTKTKFMATQHIDCNPCHLTYKEEPVEKVATFKYLGIEFSYDGSNKASKTDLYKRALKAYFKLVKSLTPLPKASVLLHLFDHLIKPILLYGCEIWAPINLTYKITKGPLPEKASLKHDLRTNFPFITKFMDQDDPIEKLHLKFCKLILGVHTKTTNLAVYSELGRYPLLIDQIVQSVKYLDYIENETNNALLKSFYINCKDGNTIPSQDFLTKFIAQLSNSLRVKPPKRNKKYFYFKLKATLKINFESYWKKLLLTDISLSCKKGGNKLRTYRLFKQSFASENYLNLACPAKRKCMAQFRLSAHRLKIETDRFSCKNKYIPPEERICEHCNMNKSEDESHFLTECTAYNTPRNKLYSNLLHNNVHFNTYTPAQTFIWLMSCESPDTIKQVATFLEESFQIRNRVCT